MVILAPLLMVGEVICDLTQPTLLARIVDQGIVRGDIELVGKTGVLMVGVALLGMMGGVGCTIAASIASQGFGTDLRSAVFQKAQSFSLANVDAFKPSTLITRITNDITQLQHLVLMTLRIVVRAPLLFIGGIIMAISINGKLSSLLMITIPVQVGVFFYLMKRGFPLFVLVQQKIDKVNTILRENLAGVRVVKAFVRSAKERKRFASSNEELMDSTVRALLPMMTLISFLTLVMNLSVVTVLWFGGLLVARDGMQVGEIMAFITYLTQIMFSLMMIGSILMFMSRAGASAGRVNEILETTVSVENPENPDQTSIVRGEVVFERVSFRYHGSGKDLALKNVSFVVHPGEMVAILGATGSGKSTLVHLIPRLYDVTQGRVLVDGRDVRTLDLHTLRSAIGMVPQEPLLFSGTIEDNIRWGNDAASEEEVVEAARVAQIHDFILTLPCGYHTLIGQRGVDLSGGQKQRIALARALVRKPTILILDDSTSAVDVATEQRILREMRRVYRGTIFMIAQRVSTVMNADKILILDAGELVAQGSHPELLESCAIYQEMYKLQVGEESAHYASR